ncbi:MAG: shikimate kinase [Planctomycetales bacterium]
MLITLIGYRGSGKSSVAAPLAARLGWEWIDADAEIEARAGMSIRDIFAAEGEAGFRRRERDTMHDLLGRDDLVIAAGGGAVLDQATRFEMQAAGPVIWLRAPVEMLEQRIAADATTAARRPDLTAGGGREEIERLLAEREPLYRAVATGTVDTEGLTVEEIVETVHDALRPLLGNG